MLLCVQPYQVVPYLQSTPCMYIKGPQTPSTPWAYTFGFLVRASDSGSRKMKKNIISMILVFFIYEHIKYTFVEFSQLCRKKIVSI